MGNGNSLTVEGIRIRLLGRRLRIFSFYKVLGISLVSKKVVASQQGLYPVEICSLTSVFLTGVIFKLAVIYKAYII
jgi:hypothetical protein